MKTGIGKFLKELLGDGPENKVPLCIVDKHEKLKALQKEVNNVSTDAIKKIREMKAEHDKNYNGVWEKIYTYLGTMGITVTKDDDLRFENGVLYKVESVCKDKTCDECKTDGEEK